MKLIGIKTPDLKLPSIVWQKPDNSANKNLNLSDDLSVLFIDKENSTRFNYMGLSSVLPLDGLPQLSGKKDKKLHRINKSVMNLYEPTLLGEDNLSTKYNSKPIEIGKKTVTNQFEKTLGIL